MLPFIFNCLLQNGNMKNYGAIKNCTQNPSESCILNCNSYHKKSMTMSWTMCFWNYSKTRETVISYCRKKRFTGRGVSSLWTKKIKNWTITPRYFACMIAKVGRFAKLIIRFEGRQAPFSKVQITWNTLMRTWRTQIGEKFIFASSTKEAAFAKRRAEICSTLLS